MNNSIQIQAPNNVLNLIFSVFIILIVIAMVVLGIKKRKIKRELSFLETQNNISVRYNDLLKIKRRFNIALAVLGSILAILVITIFITQAIDVAKRVNEINKGNNGAKLWS